MLTKWHPAVNDLLKFGSMFILAKVRSTDWLNAGPCYIVIVFSVLVEPKLQQVVVMVDNMKVLPVSTSSKKLWMINQSSELKTKTAGSGKLRGKYSSNQYVVFITSHSSRGSKQNTNNDNICFKDDLLTLRAEHKDPNIFYLMSIHHILYFPLVKWVVFMCLIK